MRTSSVVVVMALVLALMATCRPLSLEGASNEQNIAAYQPPKTPSGIHPRDSSTASPTPSSASAFPSSSSSKQGESQNSPGPNLIAVIAVSVGLAILFILAGFMWAFRIGWRKGLEHQVKQDRKMLSADMAERRQKASLPWPGQPPASNLTSIWEVGMERKIPASWKFGSSIGGSPGRHSFRPEKGVYEIEDAPEWGDRCGRSRSRSRRGSIRRGRSVSLSTLGKGKAKEIGV